MSQYFLNLCDELDASVFSGDTLFDIEVLNKFETYVDRWKKACVETKTTIEESDKSKTNHYENEH